MKLNFKPLLSRLSRNQNNAQTRMNPHFSPISLKSKVMNRKQAIEPVLLAAVATKVFRDFGSRCGRDRLSLSSTNITQPERGSSLTLPREGNSHPVESVVSDLFDSSVKVSI